MLRYAVAHHSEIAPNGQRGFYLTTLDNEQLVTPVFQSFVYLRNYLDQNAWKQQPHLGKGIYSRKRRVAVCPTGNPRNSRNVRLSDTVWEWLRTRHPDGAARAIEHWFMDDQLANTRKSGGPFKGFPNDLESLQQ